MAYPSRQNQFNDGTVPTEAKFEGEFDNIYNSLDGSSAVDINVQGNITSSGTNAVFTAPTGTNALPSYTFASDPNTGVYRVGADNIAIAAGGVKTLDSTATQVSTSVDFVPSTIVDNTIITNDVQLTGSTADGFVDTTGVTIWNAPTTGSGNYLTTVGTEVMVLTGATTASADVLGTSRYNTFDGTNDWLTATNAAFANMTDDFTFGAWVYMADWNMAGASTIAGRTNHTNVTNGWVFQNNAGVLGVRCDATTLAQVDISALADNSWHHLAFTFGGTSNIVTIYVDGVAVASAATGTITASDTFMMGARVAGSPTSKFTGAIGEAFIDVNTAFTADQMRNIYARSAKKFAVKAQDGSVSVHDPDGNANFARVYETTTRTESYNGIGAMGTAANNATWATQGRCDPFNGATTLYIPLRLKEGETLVSLKSRVYTGGAIAGTFKVYSHYYNSTDITELATATINATSDYKITPNYVVPADTDVFVKIDISSSSGGNSLFPVVATIRK